MRDREPTVRSRELDQGPRRVLEQAGLTGQQAAYLLDCAPSRVPRLLSGKRGGRRRVRRVKVPERDRLLALCRQQHTPGWLQQHTTGCPSTSSP